MAVMMQAFYWDAPIKEEKQGNGGIISEHWFRNSRPRALMLSGCPRSARRRILSRTAMTPMTISISAILTRRVQSKLFMVIGESSSN
jgi:hypothetical protein